MDDLISRQTVKELAHNQMREKYCGAALKKERDFYIKLADSIIDLLPSAQPQRMRAKWIATTSLQEGQITWIDYKCSNCSHHREKPTNFCEVCGRKMERGEAIK